MLALRVPMNHEPLNTERDRVLALLRRFGWSSTSFQVLEPGYRYFFSADGEACVAYVETGCTWISGGSPIAAAERRADVATQFVQAARSCRRRAAFALVDSQFAAEAQLRVLGIGEEPVWDPRVWTTTLAKSRSLREQLRRARAKGVRVRELSPDELASPDAPMRREIETLVARWLSSHSMAPMGFLVGVHLFDTLNERRMFVAESPQGVRGVLALVPVYARGGFLVEDLLRSPDAPNGTTETLIDHALRACAADGCSYVTLGLAPLAGDLPRGLLLARRLGRGLYDFSGLRTYKAKFMPDTWQAVYLAYPRQNNALFALYAMLSAFAQGSLVRFGLRTLLRGPTLVLQLLTVSLVPWTVALSLLDTRRYFPNPWLKWAWVAFDVLLFGGLVRLNMRASAPLAKCLAWLIAGDVGLTLLEAVLFNASRTEHWTEALSLVVAVAAPALAALVLHGMGKRLQT